MSSRNDTRSRRRLQGLCADCGGPPETGGAMCAACREKGKRKQARAASARASAGLCPCGAARDPGKLSCRACRAYRLGRDRRRRGSGVCSSCPAPAAEGRTLCGPCGDANLASVKARAARERELVLRHYGGACQLCGESAMPFLSIDHVGGGGAEHRRRVGGGHVWGDIIRAGYPAGLRCLCFNCNCSEVAIREGECRLCRSPLGGGAVACGPCLATDRKRASLVLQRHRLRSRVLAGYGGKCECCGEARTHRLTLEHKNGGGRKHRQESKGGLTVYRWVVKNGFPDSLTVLCFNCNCARGFHGGCPHKSNQSPLTEVSHGAR